jgi:DNA helicase-2/ATP-dependent DNA helicase PcrA
MCPSWTDGVRGRELLPLIELDADTIRTEAGPGAGKTFGLVRRVERILHPHGLASPGRDVLIVAFNRVIANQLKSDIEDRLNTFAHDGSPTIRTIHALCLQVVGLDLRVVLPHEREAIVYDVLTAHDDLRVQYGSFDEADQALRNNEAGIEDHLAFWQATREWLTRHRAQLLSDLPGLLLDRLAAGDLPDLHYQHIIVDEFQDLTRAEQELIFRLRRDGGQLVALGDSRQSIYRFRGNELQGLARITEIVAERGEDLVDIPLQECQRCPPEIVRAANRLMALADAQQMVAVSQIPANLHVVVWDSLDAEAVGMARAVVQNVRQHPGQNHLVMTTRRQFGYMFRDRVAELAPELRIELNFSESILETWAVREAFLFFSLVCDPDAPTWRAWLGYRNSLDGRNYKAARRNSDAYLRFLQSSDDSITEENIGELVGEPRARQRGAGGSTVWDRAQRFLNLRDQLFPADVSADELIEIIFDPDRWIGEEYLEPEAARLDFGLLRATALASLRERVARHPHASVPEHLRDVARQLRYSVGIREQFLEESPCDVQVTTLWGAKGVTADHVYILGLCDEAIPGQKREEYPGTEAEYVDEQKRLFYVSITRTKRTLVLSRARSVSRAEAMRLGLAVQGGLGQVQLTMCPFLRDVMRLLPDAVRGQNWRGCAG